MLQRKLTFIILIILFIINLAPFKSVEAEQGNSVKDWYENQTDTPENGVDNNEVDNNETIIDGEINESSPPTFETEFSWVDYVKMLFALGVVIALIYIVLKFVNQKNRIMGQMKSLENLGGLGLGTNRSIQLVRVGKRVLVLGIGESIQLLKEIESEEEINELINQQQSGQGLNQQNFLGKFVKNSNDENNVDSYKFKSMLKEQLSDFSEGRKKLYDKINKKDTEE